MNDKGEARDIPSLPQPTELHGGLVNYSHLRGSRALRFAVAGSAFACLAGAAVAQTPPPAAQPAAPAAAQAQPPTGQSGSAPPAVTAQAAANGGAGQGIPSTGFGIGLGDTIILKVDTPGFSPVDVSQGAQAASLCAGFGTALVVSAVSNDGGQTLYVRLATGSDFPLTIPSGSVVEAKQCQGTNKTTALSGGVQYKIAASAFDTHEYSAAGLEYGVLLTPYKFHIADRSLTTSATIGPYVGFHILTSPGSEISEVASIGIGNVSVASASGKPGNVSTSNQTSFSVAEGVVWTLTKGGKFQMAFLIGIDWLGHGSGYQYEGKPWMGVGFGTNLTH